MKAKREVLKNGIKVIALPSKESRSLTMMVAARVGSINEAPKNSGISHIFEHMVFKGTTNRPSAKIISEEIDSFGGSVNAYTDKELTTFHIRSEGSHFEKVAEILADLLLNPLFDQKELDKENKVILEEKKMYEDNPSYKVGDDFEELIFKGTKMEPTIIGTNESILAVTADDLKHHLEKYYVTENMTISVAGQLPENYLEILNKNFSKIKSGKNIMQSLGGERTNGVRTKVLHREMGQANMNIGFPTMKAQDENFHILKLYHVIMGASMSSRLFTEVREKRGLAYSVRTSIGEYNSIGYFEVFAGVASEKAEDALKVIFETLKDSVETLTEGELSRAKEQAKGNMVLALESTASQAEVILRKEMAGLPEFSVEDIIKKIDSVTLAEVKNVARGLIDFSNTCVAIIGPFKNSEKFDKIVNQFKEI